MRHAGWLTMTALFCGCAGHVRDDSNARANAGGATADAGGARPGAGGATGLVDAQSPDGHGNAGATFDASNDAIDCAVNLSLPDEPIRPTVNLALLVETSSRIADPLDGGESWWQAVREALTDFVEHDGSGALTVGLQYFPLAGSAPGWCQASYDVPAVEFGLLPDNSSAVLASLDATEPAGLAPTGPALEGAIEHAKVVSGENGLTKVVLITAGPPTECTPLDLTGLATIAGNGFLATPSVMTAVIGLGTDLDALNDVAQAGGSERAFLIAGGDVRAQVVDALFKIAERDVSCTFFVPPPPQGQSADFDLLQVFYGSPVSQDSYEIPRVTTSSACDMTQSQGWFFNDQMTPTEIRLCPGTCLDVQGAAWLTLVFGCPPKTAP